MPEKSCLICGRPLSKTPWKLRFPEACERPACQEDMRRVRLRTLRRAAGKNEAQVESRLNDLEYRVNSLETRLGGV